MLAVNYRALELQPLHSNDAYWKHLRHFLVVVEAELARRKLGPVRRRMENDLGLLIGVSEYIVSVGYFRVR